MAKFGKCLLVMALPLAACGPGPDQPDNIPLVGKWQDKSELTGIEITGMPADIEDVPQLKPLAKEANKTKEYCGEPYFRNKEEFQEQLDRIKFGKCELSDVQNGGSSVSASGTCSGFGKGGLSGEAYYSAQGVIGEEQITLESEVEIQVSSDETGEGESVTIYTTRTMTRLGDC